MSAVGITESAKGDNKKFEIWCNSREEVFIVQAATPEIKTSWLNEIRKVLTGQLKACRGKIGDLRHYGHTHTHSRVDTHLDAKFSVVVLVTVMICSRIESKEGVRHNVSQSNQQQPTYLSQVRFTERTMARAS